MRMIKSTSRLLSNMVKRAWISVIFLLAVSVVIAGMTFVKHSEQLVSGEPGDIRKISIGPHEYYDKEQIGKIHAMLRKIETKPVWFPVHEQEQNSDPLYSIDITYQSGRTEHLTTTETGKYVFKWLPTKNGYVGGFSEEIYQIYRSGSVRYPEKSSGGKVNQEEVFKFDLYSEKPTYKTTEPIRLWSVIEYIGKNEEITVWSGDPPIGFIISDGKDFKTGGLVHTILMPTTYKKGVEYRIDFAKSGGYSADDPKADFWKSFYAEKDLYLPEGVYTVSSGFGFSASSNSRETDYLQTRELTIKVEK